ncbi:sulfurtransferase [Luteimonas viscosa]|uniref:Sulfurtransferase n=1 Tax=Luteimonas viscosa TaxID=1132694 RepID=A0A5D4XL18_9GAMM|nr:sulfurtransferase [Luteimonas viscosa]TYT25356.1 sulfurtransferase [Luteimonas viscosa]
MTLHWNTLVSAEALAAALHAPDLVVLDCRASLADPDAGERAHRAAHVPGALHAHLERDLSGPRRPGQGRHPWPEPGTFNARLADWGISPATRVVAYDAGDGAFAARLWCLLRMLGHGAVAVLDGGWTRWLAADQPVEAGVPTPRRGAYSAAFDRSRLLDAEGSRRQLERGGLLIDARAPERFRGEVEPIDPVAGHVPGAINRPYAANLSGGRFKPAPQLRAEFDALMGGRAPGEVVAMCGSGVTACHHLLAMEHAGLSGAKLYTGSWSGWIDDPARPVATGET